MLRDGPVVLLAMGVDVVQQAIFVGLAVLPLLLCLAYKHLKLESSHQTVQSVALVEASQGLRLRQLSWWSYPSLRKCL